MAKMFNVASGNEKEFCMGNSNTCKKNQYKKGQRALNPIPKKGKGGKSGGWNKGIQDLMIRLESM